MNEHFLLTLFVFVVSSVLTYILIPPLIRLAFKKGITVLPRDRPVDIPRAIRKASHDYSIPLTGGLAIFIPFVVSMCLATVLFPGLFTDKWSLTRFVLLLFGSSVIAITGLMDDIYRLSYQVRFLITVPLITILLWLTVKDQVFLLPGGYEHTLGYPGLFLLVIWCIGLSNAVNLIDGLDGSSAGIIAIAAMWLGLVTTTGAFLVTIVLASIMASCIAFLAYNFYPARIFLGSGGTLFLGFVLAIITIWPPARDIPNYFLPYALLIFAVPLADMAIVFAERIFHKQNPFSADSWHIHDRVLQTGLSRKRSALLIWALSFDCGLIAYLSFRGLIPYLIALALVAALITGFYIFVVKNKGRFEKE